MPLKGEAHEISFKNILKYISFPLQFFIHCFLLISATVPLTRAFKLYWFPCYKIKLFLVSACCPFNQSPQTMYIQFYTSCSAATQLRTCLYHQHFGSAINSISNMYNFIYYTLVHTALDGGAYILVHIFMYYYYKNVSQKDNIAALFSLILQ